MLPPFWKAIINDIKKAVEAASRRNEESYQRPASEQADIRISIDRFADACDKEIERQKTEEPGKKRREINTIRALAAAAVFTLILDGVGACQLIEMRKVYEPIRRQAEAAADQINIMRIQLKPHMSPRIENIAVVSNGQISQWILTPVWKNVGGTEAVKAKGWDSARFFDTADEADKYDFLSRHESPDEMFSKTVPQTEEFIQVSEPLTADMAKKISGLSGGAIYVIWGHIEYGDSLFPDTIHHAHFCYLALPANIDVVVSFPLYKAKCNYSD